jgi:hypothetical protein
LRERDREKEKREKERENNEMIYASTGVARGRKKMRVIQDTSKMTFFSFRFRSFLPLSF